MRVRAATQEDAPAIGLVHVRSWQAAYKGHFPADFLNGLDPDQRGARWRDYLSARPDGHETLLVADLSGTVVGFVDAGPCRDDGGEAGEIRAIYLQPEHWDRGFGRELMTAALDELRSHGFGEVKLWVLDANRRARAFYEAGGWELDGGARVINSLGFPIAEVRYRITVA